MDHAESCMPAGMRIDFEIGPHDEDFLPWLSGHSFRGVPQGVISGQVAVADNFRRDAEECENDDYPNGQRNVTLQFVLSHCG